MVPSSTSTRCACAALPDGSGGVMTSTGWLMPRTYTRSPLLRRSCHGVRFISMGCQSGASSSRWTSRMTR